MNMAENDRDAMPNSGTFSIVTESVEIDHQSLDDHNYGMTGRYALITVTDTGTGMDAATSVRLRTVLLHQGSWEAMSGNLRERISFGCHL